MNNTIFSPNGIMFSSNGIISLRLTKNNLCAIPLYIFFFIAPMGYLARDLMPLGISPNILPAGIVVSVLAAFFGLNAKVNITLGLVLLYVFIMSVSLYTGQGVQPVLISHMGYFLIAFLLANYRFGEDDVRLFFKIYLYSLTIVVILCFFELFASIQFVDKSMLTDWAGVRLIKGPFENQNAFATFLMIGCMCVSECFSKRRLSSRVSKWFIFGLLFSALVLTASRSALLALVIGLFVQQSLIFARRDRRALGKVLFKMGFAFICILFIINSYFDLSLINDLLDQKSSSTNYRIEALDLFIATFLENPLFGFGYQNLWYETEAMFGFKMGAHNIFIGILIDFGLFACLIFVYLVCRGFANILYKLRRNTIGVKFSHTILAMIIGLMIHGQFHEIQVNTVFWLILLLAISFPNRSKIS